MTRKPTPMESSATATMSAATVLSKHRTSYHHRHQRNCKQLLHEINVRSTPPKSFATGPNLPSLSPIGRLRKLSIFLDRTRSRMLRAKERSGVSHA